ncbi:MAG: hypothetical protein IKY39_03465 [Clostridia bacterium]|nr:hypothetical protein [Clostridia bacterium]
MTRSALSFTPSHDDGWHTVFKNNHGRKLYLKFNLSNEDYINICDCFYVDRPWETNQKSIPIKLKTSSCKFEDLQEVLEKELDKKFYGIEFVNDENVLTTEAYIENFLKAKSKHKFLILVENGNALRTRFKNRTHRTIYLEIKKDVKNGLMSNCYYCDRVYKRDKSLITPSGLTTIFFDYSLDAILEIVNEELNCDFTDVIVAKDTFGFDKTELPICGSI